MNKHDFIKAFHRPWQKNKLVNEAFLHANKPAAVLIALNPMREFEVIFTVRARHLKHHPGQISFPGGKHELSDENLAQTATREAQEEIGLANELVDVLGEMPAYRTISGFKVSPFVAMLNRSVDLNTDLVIDKNEVDTVFQVPLTYLLNEENYYTKVISRGNQNYPVYFIDYDGHTIWGATAGMLYNLANHICL